MKPWETYLAEHHATVRRRHGRLPAHPVDFLAQGARGRRGAGRPVDCRPPAPRRRRERADSCPPAAIPSSTATGCTRPGKPTVLVYGHFDVQPVDPLEPVDHPAIRARRPRRPGVRRAARAMTRATCCIPILVAEALLKTEGRLPVNVKFIFEGQEEIGSPQLRVVRGRTPGPARCDLVLSADGGAVERKTSPRCSSALQGHRARSRSTSPARAPTCIPACTAAPCRTRSTPRPHPRLDACARRQDHSRRLLRRRAGR